MPIEFAPEVDEALNAVKSDDDATDWLLTKFTDKTAKNIELVAKGSGSDAFLENIKDTECLFGLVRVTYTDDSRDDTGGKPRVKFARVTYAGPSANVMLRGKVSTASSELAQKFDIGGIHVESSADADDIAKELSFETIINIIKKSNF